jgi:hypothetical protein
VALRSRRRGIMTDQKRHRRVKGRGETVDVARGVSSETSCGSDRTVSSIQEKSSIADPNNVLTIIGTITSQVVLITALLYYFGWIYTHSFFEYFGVDTSLLGYGTADYVLRSSNVAFDPFIYLAFGVLALFGLHRIVMVPALIARIDKPTLANAVTSTLSGPAPERSAWFRLGRGLALARVRNRWRLGRSNPRYPRYVIGTLRAIAIILVTVVFAGMMLPKQIGTPLGLILPLLLILSVGLLGYVAYVRSTYPHVFAITTPSTSPSRTYILTLLALGLVAGLWTVSLYGVQVGSQLAANIAAGLSTRPGVVVYSTERIALGGPGIVVAEIAQPGAKYHFQYTGLRLLVRAPDKFLLLPSRWQHGRDRVLLLRDDNSIRIDIEAW